jgi:hypothetical protein
MGHELPPRWLFLLALAVLASVCAVAFAQGRGNGGRVTYTQLQTNWVRYWPSQPARAADVARAEELVARSPHVQKLLGADATPSGSFVWLTAGRRPPVVVLRFSLSGKKRIDAIVPYAENPPPAPASGDCQEPYAPGWKRLRAQRVTRLFVAVDLDKARVADVDTDAMREVVSPVKGRAFPSCEEKQ